MKFNLKSKEQMAEFIRVERIKQGLTQSQLGDLIDDTQQNVNRWERAVTLPGTIEKLAHLCSVLGYKIVVTKNGNKATKTSSSR